MVSGILLGSKSWNHGGFMKFGKKKSWNHLGIRLGPRAGAEARGPNQMPKWFQLFFAEVHEYHHGLKIYCQKVLVNTTKTVQKINEYQVTKIKKYAGFLLKSSIGDIWDKNTAATVMKNKDLHIYIASNRQSRRKRSIVVGFWLRLRNQNYAYIVP